VVWCLLTRRPSGLCCLMTSWTCRPRAIITDNHKHSGLCAWSDIILMLFGMLSLRTRAATLLTFALLPLEFHSWTSFQPPFIYHSSIGHLLMGRGPYRGQKAWGRTCEQQSLS
jgi:hypothetical protein